MWKANVSEHGPVLDWDRAYGPKVMLYNLCDDPTEKHNLAFLEEGKEGGRKGGREVVERMYGEMMEIVREAPVQFAGDTLVTLPGERERRKRERPNNVFLEEEERVEEVEWVRDRLFYLFSRLCMRLMLVVVVVVVGGVGWCVLGRGRRRRKRREGGERKEKVL